MNNGTLILIVEDVPEIQESMKMILELENYSVLLAGTGCELKYMELPHSVAGILPKP